MSFYYPMLTNFSLETTTLIIDELIRNSAVTKYIGSCQYCPWIFSLIGSICVGLCGVFPLLIIPIDDVGDSLKVGDGAKKLRILLSFAVGGLLGDVFLHLLPEAWEYQMKAAEIANTHSSMSCGIWVLAGMLVFVIFEKIFSNIQPDNKDPVPTKTVLQNNNTIMKSEKPYETHLISGYLNLAANSIDNFTHGLAIGTSFCISLKLGIFSTFAILVHELPHEIGDFAILLKSGFSRWEAARAQVLTAGAGIGGSMVAVVFGGSSINTSWILPFTAGGFLHIALVSVLPELIREESKVESFKQLLSLVTGIAVMAVLIILVE